VVLERAVVVCGMIGLVACGGGDDDSGGDDVSAEEQPYVDAMVDSFRSGDDDELTPTADQADCVAPRWIDTIGVDRSEAAGASRRHQQRHRRRTHSG
jgi:hypothetical protein